MTDPSEDQARSIRDAIAAEVSAILVKHYDSSPMAAVLVWYREEDQMVNVVQNSDADTSIALLADAIKISLNLRKPQ